MDLNDIKIRKNKILYNSAGNFKAHDLQPIAAENPILPL